MTPITQHNVAHAVSRQIPAVLEMSQECRATPPKDHVAPVFPPPVAVVFGVFWRENNRYEIGGGRCHTGNARGVAGEFPSENGSRYTGVSQLHSHQSRYTVPLRVDNRIFGSYSQKWLGEGAQGLSQGLSGTRREGLPRVQGPVFSGLHWCKRLFAKWVQKTSCTLS